MLRTRLISAAILIPLVVYGVLYLSTDTFMLILAAILLAGVWEWGRLALLQTTVARLVYVGCIAVLFWFCYQLGLEAVARPLLIIAWVGWLLARIAGWDGTLE